MERRRSELTFEGLASSLEANRARLPVWGGECRVALEPQAHADERLFGGDKESRFPFRQIDA